MTQTNITLFIEYAGTVHEVHAYENEYRSLMHLVTDKFYTEAYGECGGMGRCGTCTVEQVNVPEAKAYQRNESATLKRLNIPAEYRLACQLNIDTELHNATFRIVQ